MTEHSVSDIMRVDRCPLDLSLSLANYLWSVVFLTFEKTQNCEIKAKFLRQKSQTSKCNQNSVVTLILKLEFSD